MPDTLDFKSHNIKLLYLCIKGYFPTFAYFLVSDAKTYTCCMLIILLHAILNILLSKNEVHPTIVNIGCVVGEMH